MRINAIGTNYSTIKARDLKSKTVETPQETSVPKGISVISFKAGNKDHVLHVVAECKPFNQTGGVATMVNEYKKLNNVSPTEKGKAVFITPYYNGVVKYTSEEGTNGLQKVSVEIARVPEGLSEGHPLKNKVGQPVYIKDDLSKMTVKEALESRKDYFLLEEIASKKMSWGMQEDAPIKLLKAVEEANGKKFTDQIYMVFSEATAYDPKPYSEGQYSSQVKELVKSWGGDPYAKFGKASVEFMEEVSKHQSGFDPASVVCSDSQAAYVTHYMAQKNAAGIEYFQGKKPIQIGHNLGDGYIGLTSPRSMLVNLDIFTPKELEALTKSEGLRNAIVIGGKDEETFFAKFFESMKAKSKFSAISIPIHYANTGYLQSFGVVSQGYLDDVTKNREIAPYLFEDLKALKDKGIVRGFTNPCTSNTYFDEAVGLGGYSNPQKLKLANGTEETIQPFKMFDKKERNTLTLEQLRKRKVENKINFLERFASKYDGAQLIDPKTNKLSNPGLGELMIRKGSTNGQMPIVQNLDIEKYLGKLKKGEDVKVVVSWGRGDFQKSLDEVLNGFKNYIKNNPKDDNTILVLGGDLNVDKNEGKKVKDIVELLVKDEAFKGKVMLLDDFAPGGPMAAMGDVAILPSRTAPCELTDLEAKKLLCTPITMNGQGMGQKNFDPGIESEAKMADAFKTKHQFFDSRDKMLESASEDSKKAFEKVFNKVKNDITKQYKVSIGTEISPEKLELFLLANEDYNDAMRKLRDEVMADDIAECLDRALNKHRNDDVAKTILKNQINIATEWENNQKITRSEKPVAELYREAFKKDAKNIAKEDVLGHGVAKVKAEGGKWLNFGGKTKTIAAVALGIAALAGLGVAGYKQGWFSAKFDEKPKEGHLSRVV